MSATPSQTSPDDQPLSFPRLQARTQRFTLGAPRTFSVSPDGRRVLFLRAPNPFAPAHDLYQLDVPTGVETRVVDAAAQAGGAESLPPEEKARRERTRTQAGGVVAYSCDREVRRAVVALSGELYLAELPDGVGDATVTRLPVQTPVVDPTLDPTGRHVGYVSGGALRVHTIATGRDRAVVRRGDDESEDVTWGLADFIAAEEMSRFRGYWWSPDGERLLATRTDAAAVARWHIADPANPGTPPTSVAYPAAGTANADVRLASFGLDGSRVDVSWDRERYPYLARVHHSAGGAPLVAVQTRDQRTVRVLAVDTDTGQTTVLAEDTDPRWVELFTGVPAWTPGGQLVRVVADDGAYRLVVGDVPVTGANLQVRSVLDVGAEDVLFTASGADPTSVGVYLADHAGTSVRAVSDVAGVCSAVRGGGVTVVTRWTLSDDGARAVVLRGAPERAPFDVATHAHPAPFAPEPELLTVGERGIRCALLFPRSHTPGTRLPVLLEPYGGPHAQRVLSTRGAFLTPQWLADQGFAVLIADGRGTPGRGPEWDRALHHEFAEVTLADQVEALHGVAARYPDDLDLSRVAIRGWSYGGYLSALAVLRRPDVFHAAVAGAPVTDWRLYDTHYTERYLGDPAEHPDVYDRNSLAGDAAKLSGQLLLIHGLADDNVFAAHTLRLSAALLAAGRAHDVLPLTNVTHMSPAEEETAEHFLLLQIDWIRRALGTA